MAMTQSEENEEDDDQSAPSTAFVALVRFAFPTAVLVLAVLYVENTYGELGTQNLYYPYFTIVMLVLLIGTVYWDEIKHLYNYTSEESFIDSVTDAVSRWKQSIGLLVVGAAYLSMINVLGFFISSFFGMILIMRIGGLRDPKMIIGSTIATLALVYVLFVTIMGLNPPTGLGI